MSTYFYLDLALLGIMVIVFLGAEVLFGASRGISSRIVMTTVIKVEGISKTFKIHHERTSP